jgi:hypothetical protein
MDNAHPLPWTVDEILKATGGELLCGNQDQTQGFEKVSIDSRNISPKDLFVAIVGDVHDGHRFANDVVNQGVGGLVSAVWLWPKTKQENYRSPGGRPAMLPVSQYPIHSGPWAIWQHFTVHETMLRWLP